MHRDAAFKSGKPSFATTLWALFRTMSDSRPTKKRKLNFSTQRIKDLESSLISALQTHGSLNGLVDLMEVMKESDGEKLHKCIWATYRIFIRAIETGWFTGKSTAGEVRKWLLNRFDIYLDLLGECMGNREDIIVVSSFSHFFCFALTCFRTRL